MAFINREVPYHVACSDHRAARRGIPTFCPDSVWDSPALHLGVELLYFCLLYLGHWDGSIKATIVH